MWTILIFFLAVLTFGFATILVAYQDYAKNRMLPIGALFNGPHPALMILAVVSCLNAIVFAWILTGWWSLFVVIVAGLIFANLFMWMLKARVQPIAVILVILFDTIDVVILLSRG